MTKPLCRHVAGATSVAILVVGCGKKVSSDHVEPVKITRNLVALSSKDLNTMGLDKYHGFYELELAGSSADGAIIALELLTYGAPGLLVARIPSAEGETSTELRGGSLTVGHSGGPLRATVKDELLTLENLADGARYGLPANGIPETGSIDFRRIGHLQVASKAPGLLNASSEGSKGAVLDFYLPTGRAWRVGGEDEDQSAYITRIALSPDASSAAALVLQGGRAARLLSHDTKDGRVRWKVDIGQLGWPQLLFSKDGSEIVVVAADPDRCGSCGRVEIRRAADGTRVHAFPLELDVKGTPVRGGEPGDSKVDTRAGYDGRFLWFYTYRSRRTGHGRDAPASCAYEVYDVSRGGGVRIRTHLDARPPWRRQFAGCAIRSLASTATGGVVAIREFDATHLEILRSDTIP